MLEDLENSPLTGMKNRTEYFLKKCKEKSEYHSKNAKNSLQCWNCLSLLNLMISSGSVLTLSIFGVKQTPQETVVITGAVFSFASIVFTRIQYSYNFNVLNILHSQIADDFNELFEEFNNLKNHYDEHFYSVCVKRYTSICEKAHIQNVRSCGLTPCC